MIPADVIAVHLASLGVGVLAGTFGWSIYVGKEPTELDEIITIYDTGSSEADTNELNIFTATIQIRVKSISYIRTYDKQVEIRRYLNEVTRLNNLDDIYAIFMSSDIFNLGEDDDNRVITTSNYRVLIEES